MKLAFTSCMSCAVFAQQPVWNQIAAQHPDRLLLLGDSVYLDGLPPPNNTPPKLLDNIGLLLPARKRWQVQLDQLQFRALVKAVPTDAIWDDHDFLWNEHCEDKAITKHVCVATMRITRALFNALCRTLDARLATCSCPGAYNDAVISQPNELPPGYKFRDLEPGLMLHLTDGRSWRMGRDMLWPHSAARSRQEQPLPRRARYTFWPRGPWCAMTMTHAGSSSATLPGCRGWHVSTTSWCSAVTPTPTTSKPTTWVLAAGYSTPPRRVRPSCGWWAWAQSARTTAYGTPAPAACWLDFFSHGAPDSVGAWAIDRATRTRTSVA